MASKLKSRSFQLFFSHTAKRKFPFQISVYEQLLILSLCAFLCDFHLLCNITKKNIFPHTNSLVCTVCFVVLDIANVSIVGNNNNSQHAIIYETSSSRAQEPNLITSFSFQCSLPHRHCSSELSYGMSFHHMTCRKCLRLHF